MSDSEKGIWNGKTFKNKYGKLIRERLLRYNELRIRR